VRYDRVALILVLTAGMAVLSRDAYPRIAERVWRREMSSALSDDEFRRSVHGAALSMFGTRVPATDQTRLLALDDVRALVRNELALSWPDAMLAKGVIAAHRLARDPRDEEALRRYFDRFLTQPVRTLDQAMNGEGLIYLYTLTSQDRYRVKASELATYLTARAESEGGTLAYRPSSHDRVRYVDSVGLVAPFLAEYGARFHDAKALHLALMQVMEFTRYGIDRATGLPFHGYNPDCGNCPVGALGWGRGAGWYALGLVDSFAWLPPKDRAQLVEPIRSLAATLGRFERADGGWGSLLNAPSPFDSSATSMLTYFLQRAQHARIIGSEYAPSVARAIQALKRATRSNGVVDFAQGDCHGLNQMSAAYGPAPYAQGATLALLSVRE
jgi:unsaturated rhamnogalacturonyl hydrolase